MPTPPHVTSLPRDHVEAATGAGAVTSRSVRISAGSGVALAGDLALPAGPRGVVAFAHGSGSSRLSPRNRMVAATLVGGGFATLLLDLLTSQEASQRANVLDVELLAERLAAATAWLRREPETAALAVGYFGTSTGAAAALVAAARLEPAVSAVVFRGGRPDLAAAYLTRVRAPTLLIVGGEDCAVLILNRAAQLRLGGPSDLAVVAGATHLFEEPGALEQVADLACAWFGRHLAARTAAPGSA